MREFENLNKMTNIEVVTKGRELLLDEIYKIKSLDIQSFTREALLKVDPNFWECPCSGTGKYHPPEDNGVGGLVRHLLKATAVTKEFSQRAKFDEHELDMAISATILHDIAKNGIPWGKFTDYTHGYLGYEWLNDCELKDLSTKNIIRDAVRYHMSPWCYRMNPFEDRSFTGKEMRLNLDEIMRATVYPSRIEMAVREADYWSSRSSMSFLPNTPIMSEIRHDMPSEI